MIQRLFLLVLASIFLHIPHMIGQAGGPYCVWEDPVTNDYHFSRLSASTGVLQTISVIPGMDAFVAGNKTTFNPDAGHYYVTGLDGSLVRFFTIDVNTGSTLSNPVITDNVVGLEYNTQDSLIYGLREIAGNYDLVTVDPGTGSVSSVGVVPNMSAYITESFTLDPYRQRYNFLAVSGGDWLWRSCRLSDAAIIIDVVFTGPGTGFQFNCQDSAVYALADIGVQQLIRIDHMGSVSMVDVLAGVNPGFVAESSSMHHSGQYTYRGFNSSNDFSAISFNAVTGSVLTNTITTDNAKGFEEDNRCSSISTQVGSTPSENAVLLYPQPSSQSLFIKTEQRYDQLDILALDGKQARSYHVAPVRNERMEVDLSGLEEGVYVLRGIHEGDETFRSKVVISY